MAPPHYAGRPEARWATRGLSIPTRRRPWQARARAATAASKPSACARAARPRPLRAALPPLSTLLERDPERDVDADDLSASSSAPAAAARHSASPSPPLARQCHRDAIDLGRHLEAIADVGCRAQALGIAPGRELRVAPDERAVGEEVVGVVDLAQLAVLSGRARARALGQSLGLVHARSLDQDLADVAGSPGSTAARRRARDRGRDSPRRPRTPPRGPPPARARSRAARAPSRPPLVHELSQMARLSSPGACRRRSPCHTASELAPQRARAASRVRPCGRSSTRRSQRRPSEKCECSCHIQPEPGQPQLAVGSCPAALVERRAQVVVVPLEALDPLGGLARLVGVVGEVRVVREVTARRLSRLARARQLLAAYWRSGSSCRHARVVRARSLTTSDFSIQRATGVENVGAGGPEARRPSTASSSKPPRKWASRRKSVRSGSSSSWLQSTAARSVWWRGSAVAAAAGEQLEAIVEPARDLAPTDIAAHARGRELDRERDPVEPRRRSAPPPRRSRSRERRSAGRAPARDRRRGARRRTAGEPRPARARPRPPGPRAAGADQTCSPAERPAPRGSWRARARPGAARSRTSVDARGLGHARARSCRPDSRAERLASDGRHAVQQRAVALLPDSDRLCEGLGHERRAHGVEADQAHASREITQAAQRHLPREAGLA